MFIYLMVDIATLPATIHEDMMPQNQTYLEQATLTLGQRIKEARLLKGWSKQKLADLVNLNVTQLDHLEKDLAVPTRAIFIDLQEVLNCKIIPDGFIKNP